MSEQKPSVYECNCFGEPKDLVEKSYADALASQLDAANTKIASVMKQSIEHTKEVSERNGALEHQLAGVTRERDEILNAHKNLISRILAISYSWVCREETAHIEMPIHDSYRKLAKEAREALK